MPTLRLFRHRVLIQPPQHLLVLWVTDTTTGARITVFHASGYEAEGMVLSGSPTPLSEPGEPEITPLPADYLAMFPEVSEVDLWNVPEDYKMTTNPKVERFRLEPGREYSITLVGNRMMQANVVAE